MSTKENPLDQPYPLALYRSMKYGSAITLQFFGEKDTHYHGGDMVRISEPVEVRFSALQNEEVIRNAIAACDTAEREARLDLEKRLAEIREQKNQLLALTHQPSTEGA